MSKSTIKEMPSLRVSVCLQSNLGRLNFSDYNCNKGAYKIQGEKKSQYKERTESKDLGEKRGNLKKNSWKKSTKT